MKGVHVTAATIPATSASTPSTRKERAVRVIGLLGIAGGVILILGGGLVWGTVSTQLRAEKITVSDNAAFLAGAPVVDPFSAIAQAGVIQQDALAATGGKTFAELDQKDPVRATAQTASFLRASLFTSVVSFGVAAFAIGLGVLSGLFGWVITTLVPTRVRTGETAATIA